MTTLKNPPSLSNFQNNLTEANLEKGAQPTPERRQERQYTYKDGCSIVLFIVVLFASIIFVAFCVSKNYSQRRNTLTKIRCCHRRMLIQAMVSNLSRELEDEMKHLFQIPNDTEHKAKHFTPRNELEQLFKIPLDPFFVNSFNISWPVIEDFNMVIIPFNSTEIETPRDVLNFTENSAENMIR